MGDWAAAMGIEAVYIDKDTTIRNFKNELMIGMSILQSEIVKLRMWQNAKQVVMDHTMRCRKVESKDSYFEQRKQHLE